MVNKYGQCFLLLFYEGRVCFLEINLRPAKEVVHLLMKIGFIISEVAFELCKRVKGGRRGGAGEKSGTIYQGRFPEDLSRSKKKVHM